MPENLRWILDALGLVSGVYTVWEIVGRIRGRFWQIGDPRAQTRTGSQYAIGISLALICGVIWSGSYVSLKHLSATVSVIDMNVAVIGWSVVFLFVGRHIFLAWERRRFQEEVLSTKWDSLQGAKAILANIGNFALSIYALYFISATQAMTLNSMSPLFLVAILLFRHKLSPHPGTFSAIVLVAIGALILTTGREFEFHWGDPVIGSFIAVAAGISFAVWADTIEDVERELALTSTRLGFLTLVFFASFAVLATIGWLTASPPAFSGLDHAILIANGLRVALVYTLFQIAVRNAGPLLATVVTVSQVPLTFLWESIFLAEPVTSELVIGVVAISAGAVALFIDEYRGTKGATA